MSRHHNKYYKLTDIAATATRGEGSTWGRNLRGRNSCERWDKPGFLKPHNDLLYIGLSNNRDNLLLMVHDHLIHTLLVASISQQEALLN